MASWAEQLQRELEGRGLAVASIPGKGRGLVASRTFFPGEVIISQQPYASTPNKILVGSSCDHCFASSNLKKCSVCRITWYCSSDCQKAGWRLHQIECRAMAALTEDRKKMLTPTIRLMVRLVLKRKLQDEKVFTGFILIFFYMEVKAPCRTMSDISDVDEKQLVLYAQMANLVNLILPSFACNAHTICDPELRPLGTGLYPVISIINHSCVPNAVLIFDGQTAYVRALQPIGKDEECLTCIEYFRSAFIFLCHCYPFILSPVYLLLGVISYIETAAATRKRQNDLKQYFFTCTCPRCVKDSLEDAQLESYRCQNQACDGFLLPDSGKIDTTEAGSVYKIIEQLEQNLYHDLSITLLHTRETLLKDWQTALMYCRLTIPVYERVYPPFHPMIGLQLYTCGKLEWLLECTEDALKSLTRAADILKITHGTKSQFMKELFGKLEEARAEVSLKLSSGGGHDQQLS
ncbi:histone-lysine N-methyltransferase ASHR1 [Gossypium australe]|uniref:Histone-lysine N-methyltransferase ASHR1 n=1 Tax=Gossypium australe TaxID=47621 RepID=A0A5B6U1G6_9ROSI|nr:histone-lysine N-methyltransferase ASHR1 [Gossypium australe]